MNYIIGVGGVGSWLAYAMTRLLNPNQVTLIDGDTLEQKNLDRQLFSADEIGSNKASALSARLACEASEEWYSQTLINHDSTDWLLCCADNDACRASVLKACDMYGCTAIIGANETHSSEAYVYNREWFGTKHDPRIYYPEIVTNHANDPMAIAIGCTGEAQVANRQLVTANFMAAALMSHLYVVWAMEGRNASPEAREYLPRRLGQTLTRNNYVLGDPKPKQKEQHE